VLVDLADVRLAIQAEMLEPCFQPLVELRTGHLAGFEVLARWKHPELGLILPANFIPLAEANGLIGQLTRQIMLKALKCEPVLPTPLVLAVNISTIQLRDLSLPGLIRESAASSGFPLDRLMVEITESALVDNLDSATKVAGELKAMGCRLALDDFGTGYSSLAHLQALPFNELKVDHTFIASMTARKESRKIVAAIVGLGHSLGMVTVAEGVETEEQADILHWLGCELAQGWLYGHALPAEFLPGMVEAAPRTLSNRMMKQSDSSGCSTLESQPGQRLAQLQAIYNGAPVGLCFLDRNLRYVSINDRLAELNGASVAAHIGRRVEEVIPDLFPKVKPYLLRALDGEAIPGVEMNKPNTRRGEPDLHVLLSYQPAYDEAQEVIGVSVALVDITERKRAEDALRMCCVGVVQRLEEMVQAPWVLSSDGQLLEIGARWGQMAGMSKDQAHSLEWTESVHPDDLAPTMNALRQALQSGKAIDIEHRVRLHDGSWRWVRARGAPSFGPEGEIVNWHGGCEDIDARKRRELSLRSKRAS